MKPRIGLIGAPGSGKQKLTKELARQADNILVTTPGGRLLERLDNAMGAFASHRDDLWAFYEQLEQEHINREFDGIVVHSGTLLVPIAHAMTNLETLRIGLQTDLVQADILRRQQILTTLTMLFLENFPTNYNFVYYLPLPESNVVGYEQRIDRSIQMLLGQFGYDRIPILKSKTPKAQAREILADVKCHLDKMEADGSLLNGSAAN